MYKNPARHAIQRFWPQRLSGGSTFGLAAEATGYDMTGLYECLMCGNPIEEGDSIETQRTRLAGLPAEELTRVAEQHGIDVHALSAYLADPRCGRLEEAEFARVPRRGGRP